MRVFMSFMLATALAGASFGQPIGEPFDECGVFEKIFLAGWCYRLVLQDNSTYGVSGDFTGYEFGDTIRVFGQYLPSPVSICMFGEYCCVMVDSVKPCSLTLTPGVPSMTRTGFALLALMLMGIGLWIFRRRRIAA